MDRLKLALVAAIMAATVVSPGLAGAAPVAGKSHHSAVGHSSRNDTAFHRGRIYNYAPLAPAARLGPNPDAPALTGGGSVGYNLNIYNW